MKRYLISLMVVGAFLFPQTGGAITLGAMYGGLVTSVIPCTCSVGAVMHYIPYFFGPPTPGAGSLYIPPTAVIYLYRQLLPKTWELGTYLPGTGECLITAPNPTDPCLPVVTEGTVLYAGTSSLSPVSLF